MTLSEHTPWEAAKLQGNLSIPFRGMPQSIRLLIYVLVYTLGCGLWEGDWRGKGRRSWSQCEACTRVVSPLVATIVSLQGADLSVCANKTSS